MLINLRNALMAGKRTPTAKDYAGFNDSVFFFDGIENAGLGVHVDTLPVDYGYAQWKNLAPMATTIQYNTDLDVAGMTPTADGLSFSVNGSTWAGWGAFNSAKIAPADASSLLAQLFPGDDISVSVEVVLTCTGTLTARTQWFAGYNEHVLYGYFSSSRNVLRYPFTNTSDARSTAYIYYPVTSTATWSHSLAFTLSPTEERIYQDGQLVDSDSRASKFRFFNNMVALLRANSIVASQDVPGKYHCVRVTRGILTADEIAANYAIDKARFGLP